MLDAKGAGRSKIYWEFTMGWGIDAAVGLGPIPFNST